LCCLIIKSLQPVYFAWYGNCDFPFHLTFQKNMPWVYKSDVEERLGHSRNIYRNGSHTPSIKKLRVWDLAKVFRSELKNWHLKSITEKLRNLKLVLKWLQTITRKNQCWRVRTDEQYRPFVTNTNTNTIQQPKPAISIQSQYQYNTN
jgi:hypothetical protein